MHHPEERAGEVALSAWDFQESQGTDSPGVCLEVLE